MKKLLNTKLKDMKAITLIALVITIVVLIILAGVIISITLGNGGIIDRAKTAKQEYANAEGYEQEQIAKVTNEINTYSSFTRAGDSVGTLESTILYPNGTKENPASITKNQKITVNNPYSGHHCYVRAEILVDGYWGDPGWEWYYCDYTGNDSSYGVKASQIVSATDDLIVVQSGNYAVAASNIRSGHGLSISSNINTIPFRVIVIKLD